MKNLYAAWIVLSKALTSLFMTTTVFNFVYTPLSVELAI
jgi:hypothetical protein